MSENPVSINNVLSDPSPELFQSLFPASFHDLLRDGLPNIDNPFDKEYVRFYFMLAKRCFIDGRDRMRTEVYHRWLATRRGTSHYDLYDKFYDAYLLDPIPMDRLPQEDREDWDQYLGGANLRAGLVSAQAFRRGLGRFFNITPLYETSLTAEKAIETMGEFRKTPFVLATGMFPGMSELESQVLFGSRFTPEKVRMNVEGTSSDNWDRARYMEMTAGFRSVILVKSSGAEDANYFELIERILTHFGHLKYLFQARNKDL